MWGSMLWSLPRNGNTLPPTPFRLGSLTSHSYLRYRVHSGRVLPEEIPRTPHVCHDLGLHLPIRGPACHVFDAQRAKA